MSTRTNRKVIAKETLEILEAGNYRNRTELEVALADALNNAVKGSFVLEPDAFPEFEVDWRSRFQTEFEVCNETTFHAAQRLWEAGERQVACLNFASSKNPGGGFLNGSQAQEEALTRASGLYPCLTKFMEEVYFENRKVKSCLYTDRMIYSPGVPVFRDDDDQLLEEAYQVSIITSPAVNVGALHSEAEHKQVEEVMLERIQKMLTVLAWQGHRSVVLGAWGCGVFRNDPLNVANYFAQHLLRDGLFAEVFERVVFAVLDRTTNLRTLRAFQDQFGSRVSAG